MIQLSPVISSVPTTYQFSKLSERFETKIHINKMLPFYSINSIRYNMNLAETITTRQNY